MDDQVRVSGDENLHIGGRTIAPAICYESLLPEHAAEAASRGADIYLASVAKPERSLEKAKRHYPEVARRHRMHIVMANSVGPCDDFQAAGRSAAWNPRGERLAQLDAESESWLSVDLDDNP